MQGLRLVVLANIPSPWAEAAKGIFRIKEIPFVAVRLEPGDRAVREWTKVRNAPAVVYDDEPVRSGWAEILELSERIAPTQSLLPPNASDRVRMFGLAHEVMGEGGLLWSGRLVAIDQGLASEGARGFPAPAATYLAKRYGYAKDRMTVARKRIGEAWSLLREALGDREFFFGTKPTALDVYTAVAVNLFALPPERDCPMVPFIRAAFESMAGDVEPPPAELLRHRSRMYERHLEFPLVL